MSLLPKAVGEVVFCEVEDGAVLLHASQEVYYGLNQVGAEIWQLLTPATPTLDALEAALQARYPSVAEATLREDVELLLDDLQKNGLVEQAA